MQLSRILPYFIIEVESFYLNSNEQLQHFGGLKDQLEVCLTWSRLLAGIPILITKGRVQKKKKNNGLCH